MCQFASSFIVPIGIRIFQFILFSVHFFAATRDLTRAAASLLFSPNAYGLLKKKSSRSQSWNKSTLCRDARVQFSTQAHEKSVTNSLPVGFNLWRWQRRLTDVILIFPLWQRTHDCPSKLGGRGDWISKVTQSRISGANVCDQCHNLVAEVQFKECRCYLEPSKTTKVPLIGQLGHHTHTQSSGLDFQSSSSSLSKCVCVC